MSNYSSDTTQSPSAQPGRGMAIASLVLGILGLVPLLGVLFALLALIFGIIVLVKSGKQPPLARGKGMAIAGVVLGGISLLFLPCFLSAGILLPALGKARMAARQLKDGVQLREIGLSLNAYANENKNAFPELGADWEVRLTKDGLDPKMLISPINGPVAPGVKSYLYFAPVNPQVSPGTTVLVVTNPAIIARPKALGNVLFMDGHVEAHTKEELQQIVAEYSRGAPAINQKSSTGSQ